MIATSRFAVMPCAEQSRRMAEVMASVQQRVATGKVSAELKAAATPVEMFLPGVSNDLCRAMPNHIARSSLFAPVARGRKRQHENSLLVSRSDAIIKFCGEQLDEEQADAWMQVMHLAARQPLGVEVIINRAEFLRSIGRHTGSEQYQWLHNSMRALTSAKLMIEVVKNGNTKLEIGKAKALPMIDGFEYNPILQGYWLRIDPRWKLMYDNREFARLDWQKRLRLKNAMAKSLQRLVATSSDSTQRNAIDWLKSKLEYSSPVRKFIKSLEIAMRDLERLEIIAAGRIETSKKGRLQAVWSKL
jgi:hypothetical protein